MSAWGQKGMSGGEITKVKQIMQEWSCGEENYKIKIGSAH